METMTPQMNARIVEIELAYRRTAAIAASRRPRSQEERRQPPMKVYAKYLRYALSALVNVAFGMMWN